MNELSLKHPNYPFKSVLYKSKWLYMEIKHLKVNLLSVGAFGVREPLPPPDSVCELRGRLADVRHQAALQPPGPVHAHRQRLAGERACHAGAQSTLPRHAER